MDTLDKMYNNHPYNLDMPMSNSHKHLVKALYLLVSKQAFETISVKEICDEAAVSRSNFYNHFDDKYHLLLFYLNSISHDFQKNSDPYKEHSLFTDFLAYIEKHGAFFSSLVSYRNGNELSHLLENVIRHNIQQSMWHKTISTKVDTPSLVESRVVFLTGGISHTIQWWILNNFPLTLAEISQMINEFIDG